jgi:DNA-directed RNA polymerase subunit RPC12/RpoP
MISWNLRSGSSRSVYRIGVLTECQNCGAPLDVKLDSRIVKCNYCGSSNRVASMRTLAEQTPRGWQAPPVWTPPPQFPAPSVPTQYHARPSVALFAVPAVVLVIGAIAAGALLWPTSQTSFTFDTSPGIAVPAPVTTPLDKAKAWDGRSTLSCSMNETLEIDGKQATVDGTVIDASIGCTVRIKNSKLKGRTVVNAAINAKVEIVNSTLDAELVVIEGAQASQITIEKGSRLISADAGIRMGQASQLTIRDSTLEAKGRAIDLGMASKLHADGARISGKAGSIEAAMGSEVTLDGTKVEGTRNIPSDVRVREK